MRDTIFKLRVLAMFVRSAYESWKTEVWRKELDAPYCCSGYECGCQAATTRDLYAWELKR